MRDAAINLWLYGLRVITIYTAGHILHQGSGTHGRSVLRRLGPSRKGANGRFRFRRNERPGSSVTAPAPLQRPRLPTVNSLVDSGVVILLSGEPKHAADDPAVQLVPFAVADLLPFPAVLHLHIALRHRDALP